MTVVLVVQAFRLYENNCRCSKDCIFFVEKQQPPNNRRVSQAVLLPLVISALALDMILFVGGLIVAPLILKNVIPLSNKVAYGLFGAAAGVAGLYSCHVITRLAGKFVAKPVRTTAKHGYF